MTTNKRFKNVEEKLDWGTVQYFTYNDEKITDKEIEKLVNHLLNQNEELKKENLDLSEELDYYKTKCSSLETGLLQTQRDVEWLRENTVCGQMPTARRTYEIRAFSNSLKL